MACALVQTYVVHLICNLFTFASKAERPAIGAALKLVCHAAALGQAEDGFADRKKDWEQ